VWAREALVFELVLPFGAWYEKLIGGALCEPLFVLATRDGAAGAFFGATGAGLLML
jgi:hypothetical protein